MKIDRDDQNRPTQYFAFELAYTEHPLPRAVADCTDRSPMNYFATIWTSPRATIRDILDTKPGMMFYPLAAVHGIAVGLDFVKWQYVKPPAAATVIGVLRVNLLFGAVLGIVLLFVFAYLVAGVVRWLGGTASPRAARTILAWASLPYAVPLLILVPLLLLVDDPVFTYRVGGTAYKLASLSYFIVRFAMLFWTLRILHEGYSEAFNISYWKGLLLSFLSVVVLDLVFMGAFDLLARVDVLWM